MEADYREYVTFHVTAKDGRDVEMAVMDEFEFEKKNYVVSAIVEGDVIEDENLFIYRLILTADGGFETEKITAPGEYERIAEAYAQMEE